MRLFQCQACGQPTFFDNTTCLSCGHRLAWWPTRFELTAVEPADPETGAQAGGESAARWRLLADPDHRPLALCANAADDACNWLVEADDADGFCVACRHNRMIPALDDPSNRERWQRIEGAKRHLFYSLMRWRLPMPDRTEDPDEGLAFDFRADEVGPDGKVTPVMTGHDHGLITLNIAEADDVEREQRRVAMGETYRTLLGHMRHEVGHYYWDRLVRDGGRLDDFRAIFGDERVSYADALKAHYENGPPADWRDRFVSAYASAHPWEDFAETWAHYLHIVDALETAHAFGLRLRPRVAAEDLSADVSFDPYRAGPVERVIEAWVPLTVAVNGINRSMGQPDLYPFVLTAPVIDKMRFIHTLVHDARPVARAGSGGAFEQLAADQHAPDLARAGADFVELGVA
ncbi:putative zinc-binding metallopeptidase [Methyloraptor flagellatus]|uniref:Zinc-binding peptidase n=1 Tax=Methyloraptor flagellatus TaxID=3162530 RepID=A0AAU7X9E6_9HYPH